MNVQLLVAVMVAVIVEEGVMASTDGEEEWPGLNLEVCCLDSWN